MDDFERFKAMAETLYDRSRDMDREHAVLLFLHTLATVHSEAQSDMLNRVESRLKAVR